MNTEEMSAGKSGFQVITYGDPAADTLLIQPVDDMDAEGMESEANIESLVRSKGFEQCVAVVNGGKCSVIVESDGLLQSEVAQISEIVWEQAGIAPENLKIIEKGK